MIVSSRTPDIDDFCNMCRDNVLVVRYNFRNNVTQFINLIWGACAKARGGSRRFTTVALANHGPPTNHWEILDGVGYNMNTGQRDDGINELFDVMAGAAQDRVDLLACSLTKT